MFCAWLTLTLEYVPRPDKLILGTAQFGLDYGINNHNGRVPAEQVFQILDYAWICGIRSLDTAPVYGQAESIIGKYFNGNPERKFNVITKVDLQNGSDWQTSLQTSLHRLGVESVDVLLFHSLKDYKTCTQNPSHSLLVDNGSKNTKLGVSVYTNEEIKEVVEDENITVVQSPFNLLDNEQKRGKAFDELRRNGKKVLARSVFLQGLFYLSPTLLPKSLKPLQYYLQNIRQVSVDLGIPIGALALQYVMSKEYIDGVILGIDNVLQLRENLDWLHLKIEDNVFELFDNIHVEARFDSLLNPSLW